MRKKISLFLLLMVASLLSAASQSQSFKKAEEYLKKGKLEIALLFYTKELNQHLDNWLAYYHRGKIYFYQKEYQKALDDFQKAFQIHPRDAGLSYFLANAYASLGMPDKAVGYYKKSLKLDPHYYFAYLNLGIVYFKQKKDKKQTIKNWKLFLKKMPDYYQADDIRRAIAYLESDDFQFTASSDESYSSVSDGSNQSDNTNQAATDKNDTLVIPDILIPDIQGEGKKAPVSKHKGSEEKKSIETE